MLPRTRLFGGVHADTHGILIIKLYHFEDSGDDDDWTMLSYEACTRCIEHDRVENGIYSHVSISCVKVIMSVSRVAERLGSLVLGEQGRHQH